MKEKEFSQQSDDYRRIEKAIGYVEANYKSRPGVFSTLLWKRVFRVPAVSMICLLRLER
ncbi:MAG: hypothetical protein NTU74_08390 [Deltaproteobacteria bacterium]|nr:hypothetical protein [Deltaproteobacteria bacterium]